MVWLTRARTEPVRAIVLHHTGGERPGTGVRQTLRSRNLSVHYVVDADGRVNEYEPPDRVVTLHAGWANGWSVGIEVVNRGVAPALAGHPREVYRDRVQGRERSFLRFHPAQVAAVADLCRDLCDRFELPWRFPVDADGELITSLLPRDELLEYRGILGHMHLSGRKVDPSPHLLRDLHAMACTR